MGEPHATSSHGARSQLLDAAAIATAAGLPGACVRVVDEVASTNAELMRAPAQAVGVPSVLIAARQSAGRGRRGRRWITDETHGLALSVGVDRDRGAGVAALVGLPLAVGVSLAELLESESAGIGLKWPNDLYRYDQKFAGVLVESRASGGSERVVVGVGLNWALDPASRAAIDQPATGLFDELPSRRERERVSGAIAGAIVAALAGFFAAGIGDTVRRWARFDRLAGREVLVSEDGTERLRGVADGLDSDGALRVMVRGKAVAVAFGDVSVRTTAAHHGATCAGRT